MTTRTGEARTTDTGTVEFFEESTTHNPWDDLQWLLRLRDDIAFYSGPDHKRLRRVIDEHVDRIVAGHAGCGCHCAHTDGDGTRGDTPGTGGHPRE